MNKKPWSTKSNACVVKRCLFALVSIITNFVETIWAMGTGVAAAMVISTSTLWAGHCVFRPIIIGNHDHHHRR